MTELTMRVRGHVVEKIVAVDAVTNSANVFVLKVELEDDSGFRHVVVKPEIFGYAKVGASVVFGETVSVEELC